MSKGHERVQRGTRKSMSTEHRTQRIAQPFYWYASTHDTERERRETKSDQTNVLCMEFVRARQQRARRQK